MIDVISNLRGGGKVFHILDHRSHVHSNWFEMGQGAVPGEGRVLCRRETWDEIKTLTDLTLELASFSGAAPSSPTISIPVRAYSCVPHASTYGGTTSGEVVEVLLCDSRMDWSNLSNYQGFFNVQKEGLPYSGSSPEFYSSTLDSGSEWSWQDILDGLGIDHSGFTFPTIKPRNLQFPGVVKSNAIKRLAEILLAAVSFDWRSSSHNLMKLGESDPYNDDVVASGRESFGEIVNSFPELGPKKFPFELVFNFRKSPTGGDPFDGDGPWYQVTLPTGVENAAAGTKISVDVGYWFAKFSEDGSLTNGTELEGLAQYYVDSNIVGNWSEVGDRKFLGLLPVFPDGKYRRILWRFGNGDVSTTIRFNSDLPIVFGKEYNPGKTFERLGGGFFVKTIDGGVQSASLPPDVIGNGYVLKITRTVAVTDRRWQYDVDEYAQNPDGTIESTGKSGVLWNRYEEFLPDYSYGHGQALSFATPVSSMIPGPLTGAVGGMLSRIAGGQRVYVCDVPNPMVPSCS